MHYRKYLLVSLLVGGSLLASPSYAAQDDYRLSANFGATSNYIWRGVSRSNNLAAVSGGVDYHRKEGRHAGVWTSSMAGGDYELDVYGGYSGKIKSTKYDAGLIMYNYPGGGNYQDTTEAYLNMDFSVMTLQAALTLSKQGTSRPNDIYLSAATELELKKGLSLTLLVGTYQFDDPAYESYFHVRAAITKGEFTFSLDKNNKSSPGSAGDIYLVASWSHAFDL